MLYHTQPPPHVGLVGLVNPAGGEVVVTVVMKAASAAAVEVAAQ